MNSGTHSCHPCHKPSGDADALSEELGGAAVMAQRNACQSTSFGRTASPPDLMHYLSKAGLIEGIQVPWVTQAIMTGSNVLVIGTYPDGVIRAFNKSAERILGYAAEEIVDKRTPEVFLDADEICAFVEINCKPAVRIFRSGFDALIAFVESSGKPLERNWTYRRRDGASFQVHISITPHANSLGETSGFLLVAHPIPGTGAEDCFARHEKT